VSSGYGWRNGLQIWRAAANVLNKKSRTADKGTSSSLGVGRGGNNFSSEKLKHVTKETQKTRNRSDTSVQIIINEGKKRKIMVEERRK
jgi:undecaprenyl pyrophosphate synthase